MWEHMYLLFIRVHSFWSDIRDLEKKGDVWTWLPADGMGVVFEFFEFFRSKIFGKGKKTSRVRAPLVMAGKDSVSWLAKFLVMWKKHHSRSLSSLFQIKYYAVQFNIQHFVKFRFQANEGVQKSICNNIRYLKMENSNRPRVRSRLPQRGKILVCSSWKYSAHIALILLD